MASSMFPNAHGFAIHGSEFYNANTININVKSSLSGVPELLASVNLNCDARYRDVEPLVKALPMAGKWFLNRETYVTWKSGSSLSRLLWLHGIPGAGKTVLSWNVITDLHRTLGPRDAILTFSCECQHSLNHDRTRLLASLLNQLLLRAADGNVVVDDLLSAYQNVHSVDQIPFIGLITDLSRKFEKTFVVVDALEQCHGLKSLLPDLVTLADDLHIFVSSRDQRDIRAEFEDCEEISIDQDDISDDLQNFVKTEVQRLKVRDTNLRDDVCKRLISGARGTFHWPVFHLQQLRRLRTDGEIRKAVDRLPQGMKEMIEKVLKEIDSCNGSGSEQIRLVLLLAVCVEQPLTLRQLAEAVAIPKMENTWDPSFIPDDPRSLVDDCAELLVCVPAAQRNRYNYYWPNTTDSSTDESYGPSDEIAIPFHPSLKEFLLTDPARSPLPHALTKYALHPLSAAHTDLAVICLSCLNLVRTQMMYQCSDAVSSNYSFVHYALFQWLRHIEASGTSTAHSEFFPSWVSREGRTGVPTPAQMAVELNLPIIRRFSKSELTVEDHLGLSLLHFAVKRSASLPVINGLLEKLDVNQLSTDDNPATALHFAACYHQKAEDVIPRLLAAGADANAKTKGGETALQLLLEWQSPERALPCIALLLQHGAGVSPRDAKWRTPLHLLLLNVKQSDYLQRIMQVLLDYGANVTEMDKEGKPPLHLAAQSSNASVVLFLLQKGAAVDAVDNDGNTALHLAVASWIDSEMKMGQHELIVQHLLTHGASVNRENKDGASPLHLLINKRSNGTVDVMTLETPGALRFMKENLGTTPLHNIGAKQNNKSNKLGQLFGERLLNKGTSPDIRGAFDTTPLHIAADEHNFAAVALLLEKGATVDAITDEGVTPLYASVSKFSPSMPPSEEALDVIQYLLHYGADVNVRTIVGDTPLEKAAACGVPAILALLQGRQR